MIKELIIKELKEIISSRIYWISFSIVLLLNILTTYVLIEEYNFKLDEYNKYLVENDKLLTSGSFDQAVYYQPLKPPTKLNVLFNGIKQFMGTPTIENNSVPFIFPETDFFFILGFLMSFMALIFSFRSISGESEDGTLKLLFSYSVKRNSFIVGKWIGGLTAMIMPLLTCFIFSIIMILFFADLQWSINESLSMLIIVILSFIYISVFFLIGIYVSIKSKNSKSSMIVSIFIWCILILVLPCVPDYIGKVISPTPSPAYLVYHTELKPRYEREQIEQKLKNKYVSEGYSNNIIDSIIHEELKKVDLKIENDKKKYTVNFDSKIQGQVLSSVLFAFISPYSCFTISGNEIAATGISSQIHFQQQSQKFSDEFNTYLNNKDKLNNNRPRFKYEEVPLKLRILSSFIPFIFIIIYHIIFVIRTFKLFKNFDLV